MKIIGITGGVGSGKSRILSYMEERFQAVVCQADHVAWDLQKPGEVCYKEIVSYFGTGILNKDDTIDRKVLGQIVFSNEEELLKLNAITHPAVKDAIRKQIESEVKRGTELFVIEAALLIEEHYDEICDELWYIYTDRQVRRERLKTSRQYTDEKIDAIMASQLPEEIFRERCQKIINNSGDFEETCIQLEEAIKDLGENER